MKNGKLNYIFYWILLLLNLVVSCGLDVNKPTNFSITKSRLSKKWVLANESGKVDKGSATHVVLSLEKTGYFLVYDTIIDSKFVTAGIRKIQPISKGQWRVVENKLILNHLLPNISHKEIFKIELLERDILITEDSAKIKHTYIHINN
jgi:hypothetical protein